MISIGINGFGRIGRAVFRQIIDSNKFIVKAVNDIDSDVDNHAYLLKYDSTYGKLRNHSVSAQGDVMQVDDRPCKFYSKSDISNVPWKNHGVDVVIDSSGVAENVHSAHTLISNGDVKKVVVTHAPSAGSDVTIMVGVNHHGYDKTIHHVISSSICDANAVAPFFKVIDDAFGIELAEVTTLHPWLQYQNLLDGTVGSVSNPGHFWKDYALGRSS